MITAYVAIKYLLVWVLPFIIAFGVARLIEPIVLFGEKKLKIRRKFSSFLLVVIVVGILVVVVQLAAGRIIYEIKGIAASAPKYIEIIANSLSTLYSKYSGFIDGLHPSIGDFVRSNVETLLSGELSIPGGFYQQILITATDVATSLPKILLFVVAMMVASYFISSDYPAIRRFFANQVSEKSFSRVIELKNKLFSSLVNWLKAQLKLLCITFFELFFGFLIIGVPYAVTIAAATAVVDAIPILGTGTVLIPWSIIAFITGDVRMGVSIILLYALITVVRQVIEPKIVGAQLGLHPLVTLISIYVGFTIMGFPGMIIFPITAIFLITINRQGYARMWKD